LIVAGVDHARSDAVVMLDSDLQHPPEVIPRLLDEFEKGHDVVFTIREDGGSEAGFLKRLTSRWFYRALGRLSTIPIHEGAADFRLISQRVATVFRTRMRERNQFLRGLFGWVGFKQTSIRFAAEKRGGGRSKYSLSRLFRFAAEGIVSFSKRPLVAAIFVGFAFAFGGLALALVTLVQYFYLRNFPPGWMTIVMLMSIFSGVQLIFLGVIGLYVGAIFDEVKARPLYIVEESIGFPPA
jgi:polyisoprenyl-phosphate glycosyltransferase